MNSKAFSLSLRVTAVCCIVFAASPFGIEGRAAHARSMLISEVGGNAAPVTVPCSGPPSNCANGGQGGNSAPTPGNYDWPYGTPPIAYPVNGSPYGLHITGPYPDGVSYAISWLALNASVGTAAALATAPQAAMANVSSLVARVRFSTTLRGSISIIVADHLTAGQRKPAYSTATGSVATYTRAFLPASGLDSWDYLSPLISNVVLLGLKPSTRYYYSVSGYFGGAWSKEHSFKTLPAVNKPHGKNGGSAYPLRIGVIGDSGQTVSAVFFVKGLRRLCGIGACAA